MPESPRGLYLHIPFCQHKCAYCDFNTYAGIEALIPDFLDALEREIRAWGSVAADAGHPAETLFFGGGTPSLLRPDDLGRLVEVCRSTFGLEAGAEITTEANPASFRQVDLERLRATGINRISFGAQSFQPDLLNFLERLHGPDEIGLSVRSARAAGFANLSVDLIYSLPRQTLAQWSDDVDRAIDLRTEHLSLYALTVEPKTPLHAWVQRGQVPEPDPDLAADMYDLAGARLAAAGFVQYEISNWARPGFESRHNLIYWRNRPYLGFGPGAHSCLDGWRFWNLNSPRAYIRLLEAGGERPAVENIPPFAPKSVRPLLAGENLTPADQAAETMMLELRLAEGVDRAAFRDRFGYDPAERWGATLDDLAGLDLVLVGPERICLNPNARLLGNEVFCRFVGEEQD